MATTSDLSISALRALIPFSSRQNPLSRTFVSLFSGRSNPGLVLFFLNSLVIQMVLGQDDVIVRFSPIYWALVLPAIIIPCFSLSEIIAVLRGRGLPLLAFLGFAGLFHLARGDFQTVTQLLLLIFVMAWCGCDGARISTADFVKIFLGSIILGVLLANFTNLNLWGLFPNQTLNGGPWRVSFSPHIANSGALSLLAFMILTRNVGIARRYQVALALSVYFLLFSFVRTVIVAAALYLLLMTIYSIIRTAKPIFLFLSSITLAAASVTGEAVVTPALAKLQHFSLASRLFLRDQTELDPNTIYEQLYRPWLWSEHLSIFSSSPHLMGLGTFRLLDHVSYILVPGLDASGSESFPTRLLAMYGFPALLFLAYLVMQLARLSRSKDSWACACFPAVVFMMMNWGSVFHPTNALFVLYFLLLRGEQSLVDRSTVSLGQLQLLSSVHQESPTDMTMRQSAPY